MTKHKAGPDGQDPRMRKATKHGGGNPTGGDKAATIPKQSKEPIRGKQEVYSRRGQSLARSGAKKPVYHSRLS